MTVRIYEQTRKLADTLRNIQTYREIERGVGYMHRRRSVLFGKDESAERDIRA